MSCNLYHLTNNTPSTFYWPASKSSLLKAPQALASTYFLTDCTNLNCALTVANSSVTTKNTYHLSTGGQVWNVIKNSMSSDKYDNVNG